ncbi:hypothetical protein [Cryobacterium sp. Hz9]|uniref:hypothetical protein n=1 Tax=Cryobacterium sp. Hz9 TaxID=1259167 RepID=UPI001F541580|nr:hypothetical protein [Cryobacterium sp. Hz9]
MFLRSLGRGGEQGAALAAVIGLMAVGLVVGSLIVSSVVGAFGFSSSSRAGVQSQSAADAGVAAARAGMYLPGNCAMQPTPGKYVSASVPVYSATIEYDTGAGWTAGCPLVTAKQVRIVSTGTAQAKGVAGVSAGDTSVVEAVFKYLSPGVSPSGIAMYLYKGATIEANSSLDLTEAAGAGLLTKNGNIVCDKNNTVINGSIVVDGNFTMNGTCSVNGSAWVSGAADLGSGSISGDLAAASVTPNPPTKARVAGTYTQGGAMPTMPGWVDLGYTATDWLDSVGAPYQVKTSLTVADCQLNSGSLGGTLPGKPLVLNMLGCAAGPTSTNNTTVSLTSDVVIYAQQFNFGALNSLKFTSSSTAARRLWFITPDLIADGIPSCQAAPSLLAQGNFTVNNGFTIADPVDALLYTPCAFDGRNGFEWHGQIYAGGYSSVQNNPKFTFTPIGVAGADLTTGTTTPVVTKSEPGSVVTMRDR